MNVHDDHHYFYLCAVLNAFRRCDNHDGLIWRPNDAGYVMFSAMCSDTFAYATADAEPITLSDVTLVESCAVVLGRDDGFLLGELFAASKRGVRPMPAFMKLVKDRPKAKEAFAALPPHPFEDHREEH